MLFDKSALSPYVRFGVPVSQVPAVEDQVAGQEQPSRGEGCETADTETTGQGILLRSGCTGGEGEGEGGRGRGGGREGGRERGEGGREGGEGGGGGREGEGEGREGEGERGREGGREGGRGGGGSEGGEGVYQTMIGNIPRCFLGTQL